MLQMIIWLAQKMIVGDAIPHYAWNIKLRENHHKNRRMDLHREAIIGLEMVLNPSLE
jgi:hypothetical protein